MIPERHFVNLSNGVDWLDDLPACTFVRVESTAIARGDWVRVLRDLDVDLLLALAVGVRCHFYDCGTRRAVSKTVSLGVPFIREVLTAVWLDGREWPVPALTAPAREVKRKLKYFRRFVATDEIRLVGHSRATPHDADRARQRALVRRRLNPGDTP